MSYHAVWHHLLCAKDGGPYEEGVPEGRPRSFLDAQSRGWTDRQKKVR